ncbi:MAG: hypothetical protein M3M98_03050 [Nitrospirota bacterium]|nr:hypothetical protein [Nitrospirota bacterium]
MRLRIGLTLLLLVSWGSTTIRAEAPLGIRPLHRKLETALATLPPHTHLLLDQVAIEQFLVELDGAPPDWAKVYGQGHHDSGHDDRLFALNRERDARREGKPSLQRLVAFVWIGELSAFDEQDGGFHVALGPTINQTGWGDVRFKQEDLPSTLIALAGKETARLKKRRHQGERVDVDVLMTGRLIQEESLVYDFSHEAEGRGFIMPVVRIEAVEFVLKGGSEERE